jgi:hypothetical protein
MLPAIAAVMVTEELWTTESAEFHSLAKKHLNDFMQKQLELERMEQEILQIEKGINHTELQVPSFESFNIPQQSLVIFGLTLHRQKMQTGRKRLQVLQKVLHKIHQDHRHRRLKKRSLAAILLGPLLSSISFGQKFPRQNLTDHLQILQKASQHHKSRRSLSQLKNFLVQQAQHNAQNLDEALRSITARVQAEIDAHHVSLSGHPVLQHIKGRHLRSLLEEKIETPAEPKITTIIYELLRNSANPVNEQEIIEILQRAISSYKNSYPPHQTDENGAEA